LLMLLSVWLWS